MPQDPLERVKTLLFAERVDPIGLLLDVTSMLPKSLLKRAILLAQNASEEVLRAFLLAALAKEFPKERDLIKLTKEHPIPPGWRIETVTIPQGKELERLLARVAEPERQQLLRRWFDKIETERTDEPPHSAAGSGRSAKRGKPKAATIEESWTFDVDPSKSHRGETETTRFADFLKDDDAETTDIRAGGSVFLGPVDLKGNPIKSKSGSAASVIRVPRSPTTSTFEEPTVEISRGTEERNDIVNLGFSHANAADKRVPPDEPLQPGRPYYFWLNIGRELKEAIGPAIPLDFDKLPEEAVLTVAIFGFENEILITPGQDVGELQIQENAPKKESPVKVLRKPTGKTSIALSARAPKDFLKDFLLFPVSVPEKEGTYRLRCNIYCSQVLVQSYVVSANVKTSATPVAEAFSKKLDYVLSQSLRAGHLASLTKEPHLLSLMVNNNGDGTHSFRFFGGDGAERYKDDAQVDGQQLAGFLLQARRAMHKVSWGDENEWDPAKKLNYRYQTPAFDTKKLAKDLAYLARAGWRIYTGFIAHLTKPEDELKTLLANPGLVQIALKLSPRAVVPAAVIYDYAWRPENFDFETTEFELCPTFAAAIDNARAGGPPLEDCDCFKNGCALSAMIAEIQDPDSDKTLEDLPPMICPSGFWGYRHSLGLPLTLDGTNKDIPPVIELKDDLQVIACVSTDPKFVERDPHLGRLKALKRALKFERDEGYKAIVKRLKKTVPHLLYFYCHGGIRANTNLPYLEIGASDKFGPEALIGERISWKGPNPLVFINGCHTTSLNPEITLDFVSSFVQQNGAAGVVGTEITIFEPLAAKFAEECLSRFIGAAPHNESMPLGKAVRGARLELLKQGNPLGLVYIPYAVGTLRLQQQN
ncbi:MAG TPA: hypothetical protein VJT15_01435 [Pyrinomonadaceae bacterium]|nr:hypothetical protein [Pyrinomonadaceae bacterium]